MTYIKDAWTILESDGTVEEDLQDINRGQTHRAKLTYEQNPSKNIDNRGLGVFHLKTHPNDGDLARGGNRNVRGGGSVVTRTRHIGPKRYVMWELV